MMLAAHKSLVESCRSCGHRVDVVVDFGPQPPSTGFKDWRHPFVLGRCFMCGLHQIIDPMPEWMWHDGGLMMEPEAHLDDLAAKIRPLGETVAGTSYKDASLVDRLVGLGMRRSWTPDVLIARHVLEHQTDPRAFVHGLKAKHVVLEVPDARGMFADSRYHFLWERHVSYFTPHKLHGFLAQCGRGSWVFTYPDPMEDALCAITGVDAPAPAKEAEAFASGFEETKARVVDRFDTGAVVFGAGHQAAQFFNLFGVQPNFVIDENADKRGQSMPGSGASIVGAQCLSDFDTCYLALRSDNADAVMNRYQDVKIDWRSLHALTKA
jgi:hypothetical protein